MANELGTGEARAKEQAFDLVSLITCMNYAGLQELRQLLRNAQDTQNKNIVFLQELLPYLKDRQFPREKYEQIMFDIELFYIKTANIQELSRKIETVPELKIKSANVFRQIFAHGQTPRALDGKLFHLHYVKWIKKDLSEICFKLFNLENTKSKDVIMFIRDDLEAVQTWWKQLTGKFQS